MRFLMLRARALFAPLTLFFDVFFVVVVVVVVIIFKHIYILL